MVVVEVVGVTVRRILEKLESEVFVEFAIFCRMDRTVLSG